jgi:hypothetical protein
LNHTPNDRSQNLSAPDWQAQEAQSRRNFKKFAITAFGLILGGVVVSGFVIAKYDYIQTNPPTLEENAR